jgi:hypothetical protein
VRETPEETGCRRAGLCERVSENMLNKRVNEKLTVQINPIDYITAHLCYIIL